MSTNYLKKYNQLCKKYLKLEKELKKLTDRPKKKSRIEKIIEVLEGERPEKELSKILRSKE